METPPPALTDLTDAQKEAVLAAHSTINILASEIESNQPGPYGLLAYAQKLKDAAALLLPLLLEEANTSDGEPS